MAFKKPAKKEKDENKGGFLKKWEARRDVEKDFATKRFNGEFTLYAGDPALHWATGGYIRGRSNLFFGPTKSGKSTLALMAAGAEQKKTGGCVIVFDSEFAHDQSNPAYLERCEKCGIDVSKLVVYSGNELDDLFGDMGDLEADLKANKINVSAIIVDSWGGVQSDSARDKIMEGDISGAGVSYGGNAKFIGPVLQSLLRISAKNGITNFFVQHCIENMDKDPRTGQPRGPKWTLLGGQRLRYLCHGLLFVESVESKEAKLAAGDVQVKKDEDFFVAVGKKIRARCEKSRSVVEGRKVEFWLNFTDCHFAKPEESLLNLAKNLGIIAHPKNPVVDKKGNPVIDAKTGKQEYSEAISWWQYPASGAGQVTKWNGTGQALQSLAKHKELYDAVLRDCMTCASNDAAGGALGDSSEVGGDAPTDEEIAALQEE